MQKPIKHQRKKKSQQRSLENTNAGRNHSNAETQKTPTQEEIVIFGFGFLLRLRSWFGFGMFGILRNGFRWGVWIFANWDHDLGLRFWEMDLDEEGRNGLGFWGLGRREEDGEQDLKWRKKKEKKNEGRRWWTRNLVLKTRVPRGSFINLSFASTQKLSLLNPICYSEIESKRLELLDTKIVSNLG